jgi:hypothetical protein
MQENETSTEANATKAEKRLQVKANNNGVLMGTSLDEQYRMATAYSKSGLMPQALNTPEKVLVALQLCFELGLPPMTSIGKVCVINGTPAIFGDLPLSLVMKSGLLEDIDESLILDPENNVQGATCSLKRRGLSTPVIRSFTLKDASQAGLLGRGPWKQYTKRMLQLRARSWALKDLFPDVLSGVYVAEYDHNATVDAQGNVVGETKTIAEELNSAYGTAEEKTDQGQEGAR